MPFARRTIRQLFGLKTGAPKRVFALARFIRIFRIFRSGNSNCAALIIGALGRAASEVANNHVGLIHQTIQVVSPPLHHALALWQE